MGCQHMGAVTYPDPYVVRALSTDFVPVKLESAKSQDLARSFNVRWLPGLVMTDAEGRLAHAQVGFLSPGQLLPELDFARGVLAMGAKRYDEAHELFERVAGAGTDRAPEALFWKGISRYRQGKQFADCQAEWRRIVERWPDSQWRVKVEYAL